MQPFFSLNRKKISNTLLVIVHGIPVVPYGTEGRGAIIAVRGLQCAVFPAKNIEVVCTAPEVEQALDALIFVFDSCTFDDNRKSGARFHLPQQRRAARLQPCATLPERAAAPQPMGTTRVGEALLELEEKLRMPLVLHYMEGYSVADVAAVLRIPQGTVKTRLRRGREALKALLTPPIGGVSRDPG